MNTPCNTYSIFGLGKLGASMAAAIAGRGFRVIGVDIDQQAVAAVNNGCAPVRETNLNETIRANRNRLCATTNHRDALMNSDISFVAVPTPSDERGAFSLQYVAQAFREIGRALAEKNRYHNIILTSTVLPGSTRYGLLPILERESGKRCGLHFGLCYSPEFIALGSVIHDFLNPDFNLIGEFDEHAGAQLEACYARIVENGAKSCRMSIENAELSKIALNTFVTTKITFANMLADLCERIPGGDVDIVTRALGLDRRIGSRYFVGALGYGGPCFPRDNIALGFLARSVGSRADLAETIDHMNRSWVRRILERIQSEIHHSATIAVLGLAYKPYTHVTDESQGIYIAEALSKAGARVIAFDPLAGEMARAKLGVQVVIMDSLSDCLEQADVVILTTPDPIFRSLRADQFPKRQDPVTVIDCWRILERSLAGESHIRYIAVGRSHDDGKNADRFASLWNGMNGEIP